MANLFRLSLHCAAHNLLVRLRALVACPPDDMPLLATDSGPGNIDDCGLPAGEAALPAEALAGAARRTWFNRRRRRDVLGEGHASTWRTHVVKVAAEVRVTARRIVDRLSESWPHLHLFSAVSRAVTSVAAAATAATD